MSDDLLFRLSKPITVHGKELTEIQFREPTGMDIIHVGVPVKLDMASDPPKVEHDTRRMSEMIARLGDVPPSSQAQMDPQDWMGVAWLLSPFFMPRPGTI